MTHARLGWCLSAALVAVLLWGLAESPARPAGAPDKKATLRLAPAGNVRIDDLWVYDAVPVDDTTLVLVGTRAGAEDADPNTLAPNGAMLDLATKKSRPFTNGHTARICSVAVRKGRIATAAIGRDPLLRLWDVKEGKTVQKVDLGKVVKDSGYDRGKVDETTEQAVAWFHKSDTLAIAADEYVILLDSPRPNKVAGVLRVPRPTEGWAQGPIAVSPDDEWVACPLGKANVAFWKVKTARATDVSLIPKGARKPDAWSAHGVVFGPTGQLFAWRSESAAEVPEKVAEKDVPADRRGVVRIELTDGGKFVPLAIGQSVYTLYCAIDPTGKWLATAGTGQPDNEVRVYHLPTGALVCREPLKGEHPPKWVAFTPSGKRLVCATLYGLVRWWQLSK
jgi:WD40 repeat protein